MSSDEYGSTTGSPTPGPSSSDEPSGNDAARHVDTSTEEIADRERQDAARNDIDRASERDRVEEGRFHQRSQGDRP